MLLDSRFNKTVNLLNATLCRYDSEVLFNNNKFIYEMNRIFELNNRNIFFGLYNITSILDNINLNDYLQHTITIDYHNEHYIDCRKDYIDFIMQNANKYELNTTKEALVDFVYNILNSDYSKRILGMIVINASSVNEFMNITHPLILLDFFFNINSEVYKKTSHWDQTKLKVIVFEYPDEFIEKDTDKENLTKYFDDMKNILLNLMQLRLDDIERLKLEENKNEGYDKQIIVCRDMNKIYKKNLSLDKDSAFIVPVDRMATYSTIPFYGWNYVKQKDHNSMIGKPLFNLINMTGNLSNIIGENKSMGYYCTGSLPKNMEGLNSLKGNNLSSAYIINCIDITKNYTWIQANLMVSKYLIEVYKGINK